MKEQPLTYVELRKQQSDELNAFPMFFDFDREHFINCLQKEKSYVKLDGTFSGIR